jgi:hypothetical protein
MNLLKQSVQREIAGIESMRRFANPAGGKLLDSLISDIRLTRVNHTRRIDEWFMALGEKKASRPLTEREQAMTSKVPKMIGVPGDHLRGKQRAEAPKTLHPLMAWEALNYVDGERSILDVFRIVQAEAMSAGEWYYGKVTLDDIATVFNNAEKEEAVEIIVKPVQEAAFSRESD